MSIDTHISDIWIFNILPLCDLVQLHVLYCTCQKLKGWVDPYVRGKYHKLAINKQKPWDDPFLSTQQLYMTRFVPVPGLLIFSEIPEWSWIESLFSNITCSLLNWYGVENVQHMLRYRPASHGMHKLLWHANDYTDAELITLIDMLLHHNLIPRFLPMRHGQLLYPISNDHLATDPIADLSDHIINSGRTALSKHYFPTRLPKDEESWHERLQWAIYSGVPSMMNRVYEEAIYSNLSISHYVEAIQTSDIATEWILELKSSDSVIELEPEGSDNVIEPRSITKLEPEGSDNVIEPRSITKLERKNIWETGEIFRCLVNVQASAMAFERASIYFSITTLSPEFLLITVWKNLSRGGNNLIYDEHLDRFRPVLDWLHSKNILTEDNVQCVLMPIFEQQIRRGPRAKNQGQQKNQTCRCPAHAFCRYLREKFAFSTLYITWPCDDD